MKPHLISLLLLVLCGAACDAPTRPSEPVPPDTLGPRGAWTLGPCATAPGTAALFIGGPDFACTSSAGTATSALRALGYLGGDLYLYDRGNAEVLLVLDNPYFLGAAHALNLSTGRARRLSVTATFDSQIAQAGPDRYLVADYLLNPQRVDTAAFVFSFVEGGQVRQRRRIAVPGYEGGEGSLRDGDYHAPTNTSAHLFSSAESLASKLLVVNHTDGSYRVQDLGPMRNANVMRYTPDGTVLLANEETGSVRILENIERSIVELGQISNDPMARRFFKDNAGEVYTFSRTGDNTRLLRFLARGAGVEKVADFAGAYRYLYVSPSADVACLRTFRPSGWSAPTYDDVVTVYDLKTKAIETHRITLRTDYFEFPRFACL